MNFSKDKIFFKKFEEEYNFKRILFNSLKFNIMQDCTLHREDKKWSKELSLCHKLRFSITYIFATQCRKPLIF